ncbi:MAG: mechanosensitive ion channel, partial [Microbacterium sp.]|nr:mechanosensitive ion channel [Microbacterium sp.]
AQGIFSDLFAALSILFDKPFRLGEIITYDQTTARVEKIGLKSTRLRAMSGEGKIISNANLLQKEITSLQHLPRRRVKFALGIIYQTPVDLVARIPQILQEVVEGEKQVFIHAGMVAFGTSSLDFEMEFDIRDPDEADYFMTRHRVALGLLRRRPAVSSRFQGQAGVRTRIALAPASVPENGSRSVGEGDVDELAASRAAADDRDG